MEIYSLITSDLIQKYRNEINKGLSKIYPKGPQSLYKPISYVLNAKGKRLRPLLTLISAKACGGSEKLAMSTALAVEVLHNFTLVHDDIMDQDNTRHGQQTVHNKWDESIAILVGDAMLSLALKLLNKSSSSTNIQMKIFIDGLLAVCEGQALDKEFESLDDISIDDYISMIDLKTGHMIGLAAELGAVNSGVDNHISKNIRDYGRLVGRAFQIQDDYFEIFSNSIKMGKSLESDILLGKKTFLMIEAIEKDKNIINSILKLAKINFSSGLLSLREFLTDSGIKDKTIQEIHLILDLADKKLNNLSIDKNKLLYFSELIKKRGY